MATTIVLDIVRLAVAIGDECRLTYEFCNQLSFYAVHIKTLSEILAFSKAKIDDSHEELLIRFQSQLRELNNMVLDMKRTPTLGLVAMRREFERNLKNLLSDLVMTESSLNTALNLSQAVSLSDIQDQLKMNADADEKAHEKLDKLSLQFDAFVKKDDRRFEDALKEPTLLTFYREIANQVKKAGSKSQWVQTSTDFKSFLTRIQANVNEHLLKEMQKIVRMPDIEIIELMKKQTSRMLDEVGACLEQLPENFTNAAKSTLENLTEQRERVQDLCLKVCFVGPAKSGKSTTINAILGTVIMDSDTLPCTVMPTTVRHTLGQRVPRMTLDAKAVDIFEESMALVKSHITKVEEIKTLKDPERACLQQLKDDTLSLEYKYDSLNDIQNIIRFMNHFCRLFARAQSAKIFDGRNPVLDLINDKVWPVIELEMAMLHGLRLVGSFELVDSPGRDETDLIPEIKNAVESVMRESSAVVCVLDITKFGTNSTVEVKKELKAALRFQQPTYLLANRINQLPADRKRDCDTLQRAIGCEFLDDQYDSSTQQVFGVNSQAALMVNRFHKVLTDPDAWAELKNLCISIEGDGVVSDVGGLKLLDQDLVAEFVAMVQDSEGKKYFRKWLRDNMDDTDEAMGMLNEKMLESKFDPFKTKLMKELAPVAGQKILSSQIGCLLCSLNNINSEMDLFIDQMLLAAEEFQVQQEELTQQLNSLEVFIKTKVPVIKEIHEREFYNRLDRSVDELAQKASVQLNLAFQDILDKEQVQCFKLRHPPSEEEVRQSKHYLAVAGQRFFEAVANRADDLQKELRKHVQSFVDSLFEDFLANEMAELVRASSKLREAFVEIIKSERECSVVVKALATVSTPKLSTPVEPLVLPHEDMGSTESVFEQRKLWYTLWMVHGTRDTGSQLYLLSFDSAKKTLTHSITSPERSLLAMAVDTVKARCKKHFSEIAEMVTAEFQKRVDSCRQQLQEVGRLRGQAAENKESVAVVAHSRILLEGVCAELDLMNRYSAEGLDKSAMGVKKGICLTTIPFPTAIATDKKSLPAGFQEPLPPPKERTGPPRPQAGRTFSKTGACDAASTSSPLATGDQKLGWSLEIWLKELGLASWHAALESRDLTTPGRLKELSKDDGKMGEIVDAGRFNYKDLQTFEAALESLDADVDVAACGTGWSLELWLDGLGVGAFLDALKSRGWTSPYALKRLSEDEDAFVTMVDDVNAARTEPLNFKHITTIKQALQSLDEPAVAYTAGSALNAIRAASK